MPWHHWGRRLKRHMKDAAVTQEQLAERMEVTQSSIANWLNGRREINLSDFFRLCDEAGALPMQILFGDSEEAALLTNLQRFLAENPRLQHMIARPATPPIIAAASLPPPPLGKRRNPIKRR